MNAQEARNMMPSSDNVLSLIFENIEIAARNNRSSLKYRVVTDSESFVIGIIAELKEYGYWISPRIDNMNDGLDDHGWDITISWKETK